MKRAQGSSEEAAETRQNRNDLRLSTVESESQLELCGETAMAAQESEEGCKGLISLHVSPHLAHMHLCTNPECTTAASHVVCTRLVIISLVVKHSTYVAIVDFMERIVLTNFSTFCQISNLRFFSISRWCIHKLQ